MGVRELATLELRIDVLEVETLRHVGRHELELSLCKRLSQANSHASIERAETGWVALLAFGSEAELAGIVEAVGKELGRSLPFALIHVHAVEERNDQVALRKVVLAELHVIEAEDGCRYRAGSLKPQRFVHDPAKILKIHNRLQVDSLVEEGSLKRVGLVRVQLCSHSLELLTSLLK